jgi:glycosyltransferase involved in cell wall biosynthesis
MNMNNMESYSKGIIFLLSFPVEPNKGGVQKVTSVLAEEFERRGYTVLFFVLGEKSGEHCSRHIFSESSNAHSVAKELKDTIVKNNISYLINQAGIYRHVLNIIEPLKGKLKLYTVHHNCIKELHVFHKEILLGGVPDSHFLRRYEKFIPWNLLRIRSVIKYKKLFNRAASVSNMLVLLNERFKEELPKLARSKSIAIPNPLPFKPDKVELEEKTDTILFVGRIEYSQKRVDRLVPIWKEFSKHESNYTLQILGDGSWLNWLKNEFQKEKLNNVEFLGHGDPRQYYIKSKVLLMTSDFEGFGMTLIEAQAYGVVPVATNCFSGIELVIEDNVNGYLVKSYEIAEFLEKLLFLTQNSEVLANTSHRAMESVNKFLPSLIVNQWEECFES